MIFSIGEEVIFKDKEWFNINTAFVGYSQYRIGNYLFTIPDDTFSKKFIVVNKRFCSNCLIDEIKIKTFEGDFYYPEKFFKKIKKQLELF